MGVIGRYETHEQIGVGSMGVVYRARDLVLDRDVALKVLRTGPNLDAELKERFYREARAGAKLLHPNIAIVYDLGEANDVPYIAMELLSGADLRRYIEEQRPLPLAQKVELLAQVCDGLAHAHRSGIIHRDIKPSNIFIHEERQAKVLDFGTARLPSSKLTVVGKVLGTPNYMSPEQILSRPCDQRSDVFSAAIVFYEFLVHAHPFQGAFIPRQIAEHAPDSLYERDPLIPASLEQLLQNALAKRPEDRIQTAAEFAVGLRSVLDELRTGLAPHPVDLEPSARENGWGAVAGETGPSPPEEDSRGWRVSEFIRLVKEFEAAIKLGNLAPARRTAEQMRQLALVDGRFVGPVEEYERQLADALSTTTTLMEGKEPHSGAAPTYVIPSSTRDIDEKERTPLAIHATAAGFEQWDRGAIDTISDPAPTPARSLEPVATTPVSSKTEKACSKCGAPNRESATFCRDCGAHLSSEERPSVREPEYQTPAPAVQNTESVPDYLADGRNRWLTKLSTWAQAKWVWLLSRTKTQKLVAGVMALSLLIIISASVAIGVSRQVTPSPEPVLGQAMVMAPIAYLLDQPTAGGKRLMSLRRGTLVNLLSRLDSRSQEWIRVQAASSNRGKNSRPGYLKTIQLTGWSSPYPEVAWGLISFVRPGDGAGGDVRWFAQKLDEFCTRFPSSPQVTQAQLQRAQLYVASARRSKNAGRPLSDRQQDIEQAGDALTKAAASKDGPSHKDELERLRSEIEEVNRDDTLPPPPPSPSIAAMFNRLPTLKNEGRYNEGLALVDQILGIDNGNKQALWWRKNLSDAKDAEERTR